MSTTRSARRTQRATARASSPRVDKWLDLLDRVGWTALQAAGSAVIVVLTDGDGVSWVDGVKFVAIAAGLAAVKVLIGQRTGSDETGSLIGRPVIEPPAK